MNFLSKKSSYETSKFANESTIESGEFAIIRPEGSPIMFKNVAIISSVALTTMCVLATAGALGGYYASQQTFTQDYQHQ